MLRECLLLLCAICTAAPFQHDHGDGTEEFKDVVERVVRATRENLRPVKTFRVTMQPSAEYWYEVNPVDVLPGASQCRVYEHPRMEYRCEWKKEKAVALASVYGRLVKELSAALGAEWTPRRSARPAFETRFEPVDPERNGVVQVGVAGASVEVIFLTVPERQSR